MREFVVVRCGRRSRARFSTKLSTAVTVAALAVGAAGCSPKEPLSDEGAGVFAAALNSNPQITNFGVYAQNSVTLRDRAVLTAGDVGVQMKGTGPFLAIGYELALVAGAKVDTTHNTIANRILLDGAKVGDIQTNAPTVQNGGTYAKKYVFPTTMPALPTLAPVFPGTTALTVNPSSTVVASPGSYGAVSIGTNGILRLSGGVYHVASLQLDDQARIEAQAAVQVRVAGRVTGRLSTLARVWIGAAAGATLAAGDIRIEVSGKNGTGGGLTETPKAVTFGNDATILGVILAPNGTLLTGQRNTVTGALVGRDVYVDIDSKINFQSGVAVLKCAQFCNDGNPCTNDTCTGEVCSYPPLCDDGLACTTDTCNGTGGCTHTVTAGNCAINGACYPAGATNPANTCQQCTPATSQTAWSLKSSGTVCRAAAGACDKTEVCDGTSPACPADAFLAAATVCRASVGPCDVAETCNGASAACPPDVFVPSTTVCRASVGPCDVAETCNGASAACPPDALAPPTTVCRASAGPCDVAEVCNGTSAACPPDVFVPPTTVCRASVGACDVAETCTGAGPVCPADAFVPATTVCRASAGACDVAETCTGVSAACPPDALAPPTTVCRASVGACDVAETCTGASTTCPPDGFLQASLACRPAAGPCDVAEVCSGTSAACPDDAFLPRSTICRASTGTCDPAESCTGSDPACPPDISHGLPAPTGLSASYSSAGAVLTWDAVPGASSYNVQRSWAGGSPYTIINSYTPATTYTDGDLAGGLTFHYVVTAFSALCGGSPNSDEVEASSPTPPRTLPPPPREAGCYLGTANGWQMVDCTSYDELEDAFKKYPQPAPISLSSEQPSICAGPPFNPADPNSPCLNHDSNRYWTPAANAAIQFGQVDSTIVSIPKPTTQQPSEYNQGYYPHCAGPNPNDRPNNTLGLQANTNFFVGTKFNHRGWVQFVMMSLGSLEEVSICIWQIDFDMNPGWQNADAAFPGGDAAPPQGDFHHFTYCVGGSITGGPEGTPGIKKRAGEYKPMDFATIAASTYKNAAGDDMLGMVAQLSWWDSNNPVQDPNFPTINLEGLYALVRPDELGLAGQWTNLSGGLIGTSDCAKAMFSAPSLVVTRLLAGRCLNGQGPVSEIPWPGSCPGDDPYLPKTSIGHNGTTGESNNLLGLEPTGPTALTPDTVYTEYWESTDGNCPTALDPHVYVRDSYEDTGVTPSNIGGQPFWESPDIFLVPHDTPIFPAAESNETLLNPKTDYDIWVRVNNDFGCADVKHVQALVYLADPSALEVHWIEASAGGYSGGVGHASGITAKAHRQALLGPFTFTAPQDTSAGSHKCIIAAIKADNEPAPDPNDVLKAPDSYQVAQRNIQFSDCAYPLTNTSSSSGSLDLTLSVNPPNVLTPPKTSGDLTSDIEFSIDDWSKAWYATWQNQLSSNPGPAAFAVRHDDASGQTIITLAASKPSVTLARVTLDANTSPTVRVTKVDAYDNGKPAIATAAVHTKLTVGGVTVENGGSCRTPTIDE